MRTHKHQLTNLIGLALLVLTGLFLSACDTSAVPSPETIVETVVVTEVVEGETVELVITATPEPTQPFVEVEEGPRSLLVCLGQEPDTLYPYGGNSTAMNSVLQAVYDGPIDTLSFDLQPVILEKIPSLADGDAIIEPALVTQGELIVDSSGTPVVLEPGVSYRPSGCSSGDCALAYVEGEIVPIDQMIVTFRLLPGLQWSDGLPLTAGDSVYSFDLAAHPDTPTTKYTIDRTSDYSALDDITVQWTGLPGFIDHNYRLNFWTPYPEHLWGQFTAIELLTEEVSSRQPVGWGPYVIEEWVPGSNIRMRRNDNYFRADEGLPKFDTVIFRMVGENPNANIAKILSGECDIVDRTSQLGGQSELLLELQAVGQVNPQFVRDTIFEHLDFGIQPSCVQDGRWTQCLNEGRSNFFGDVRVRRAIAMCLNREAVVDTVLFGQSLVLDSYLPPEHPLSNPDVMSYPFDPVGGSTLLEEAGWVLGDDGVRIYAGDDTTIQRGARFSIRYTTTSPRQQAAQILAQGLAACGIEANLEYLPAGEFFAQGIDSPLVGRDFDLVQFNWPIRIEPTCTLWATENIPGEDPEIYPYELNGLNYPGFSNADFDAACYGVQESFFGNAGYLENNLLAQAIFAEEMPIVPLYQPLKLAVTRPDMCNFRMDPTASSELWNIESLDYGEGCP